MQKEMHNKITRLLYELNALDKGAICLADMATEIGVSLRTLQRDMRDTRSGLPALLPNPRGICVCRRVFFRKDENF